MNLSFTFLRTSSSSREQTFASAFEKSRDDVPNFCSAFPFEFSVTNDTHYHVLSSMPRHVVTIFPGHWPTVVFESCR